MKNPVGGQVLMIAGAEEKNIDELTAFLKATGCEIVIEHDFGSAINRVQNSRFDVIVLDACINCVPLEHTIQILRGIDPKTKIIIKTKLNTKELEAKARKEKIYYYHLDSFGPDDLKLAIESALNQSLLSFASGKKPKIDQKSILMVDANDDFIEIHRTNLEKHNFKVDTCFDTDRAYQKIITERPHLIMIDLDIPVGSDGLHFIEKVMDNENVVKIPVLLFTPEMKSEFIDKILVRVKSTLPNWNYLEKPIKIEDIIPKVRNLLSKTKE